MTSLPGRYSPREIKCRSRITLFDRDSARQAGTVAHGSVSAMEQYASKVACKKLENYSCRKRLRKAGGPNPRRPRSGDGFDGHESNPRRFMGAIRAPFLDVRTGSSELGFHCLACKVHHYNRPLH